MSKYCDVIWIFLLVLFVKNTTARPSSRIVINGEATSDVGTEKYTEYEYSDEWPSQSSGFEDYAGDDLFMQRSYHCPEICTCVVQTILYCSRREIRFIGSQEGSRDIDGRILAGPIPMFAKAIHLGYNNITFLPARLFDEMTENGPNIISDLYLQQNQISTVHPDAFVTLTNLKSLDLSNNRISHLVQKCEGLSYVSGPNVSCVDGKSQAIFLRSLPKGLRLLNLNGNFIRGIPNCSFESLPNLEVLRLSFNRITWINRKAFYGLVKLRVLQIRANSLGTKTAQKLGDIFQHFITQAQQSSFYSSDLQSVKFYPKHVDLAPFNGRSRRNVAFDGNDKRSENENFFLHSLEDLDLGQTNISEFPTVIPPSVRRLYMDLNRISAIPKDVLNTLKRIQILQLGGNRIAQIPDATFSTLHGLRVLDLSRNNLTQLTSKTFNGLLRLVSLRLYGNRQLSKLPRKVFWSLPMLRILYLHNCNLTNLPSGPWMFRVLALWLYGNPIKCNCQNLLSLMVRIYRPIHPSFNLRLDPYRSVLWDDSDTWEHQMPVKTKCATPLHFRGDEIESIRVSDVLCTYQDHYETEISRQISSSRFLSADYQQDQSAAEQSRNGMEKLIKGYGSFGAENIEKGDTSYDKVIGKQFIASSITEEIAISGLVNVDFVLDSPSKLGEENHNGTSFSRFDSSNSSQDTVYEFSQNIAMPSDFNFLENNGKEKLKPVKTHLALNNTLREWTISVPATLDVEQKHENLVFPTKSSFPLEQHNARGRMAATATRTQKDSPCGKEREIENKTEQPYDIPNESDWDTLQGQQYPAINDTKHNEDPRGSAGYVMYDDGDVELDLKDNLRFDDDKASTLSQYGIKRLREEMQGVNAWKSYQEYYGDVESSGDFEATMRFVAHMKDLTDSGATTEDLIGNLTKIYSISGDYLDYEEPYSVDGGIGEILDGDR